MDGWQVTMLIAAVVLIASGTWVLTRSAYRQHRLVLAAAAVAWGGGVAAFAAPLSLL